MSFTFIRSALKAATLPAIYCHVKWTYGPRAFRYFVGHISTKSVTSPPIRSRDEYQNVPICYNLPPIGDTLCNCLLAVLDFGVNTGYILKCGALLTTAPQFRAFSMK